MRVGDIMTREVLSVPPEMTIQQLLSEFFLLATYGGYSVVKDGELGMVTLQFARWRPKLD